VEQDTVNFVQCHMFQRIRKAIQAPGVKRAVTDDVAGSSRQGDLIQRKPSLAQWDSGQEGVQCIVRFLAGTP
jgi:hypothetical protein